MKIWLSLHGQWSYRRLAERNVAKNLKYNHQEKSFSLSTNEQSFLSINFSNWAT